MEVVGKIIAVLPLQSGKSQAGREWKKQEYVLETMESFPRKVAFDFFGERVDQFPLKLNDVIRLSFDIESREYNGRWYTNIHGWKSEPADGQMAPQPQQPPYQQSAPGYQAPAATPSYQQPAAPMQNGFPTPPASEPANDDLPF